VRACLKVPNRIIPESLAIHGLAVGAAGLECRGTFGSSSLARLPHRWWHPVPALTT
jgi:hypothetical protein